MKICKPKYFDDFKCVASECTDTCCALWQVELDGETSQYYKSEIQENSKLGKTLGPHIKANKFLNTKNGNCPFLDGCLLCRLHTEFGEDVLPETCRLYPRFYNRFGGYVEEGISFSCPTAAGLIANGSSELYLTEIDELITDYTDVNAELFLLIKDKRNEILSYIDSDVNIRDKISALLSFSADIQRLIDKKCYEEIKNLSVFSYNSSQWQYKDSVRTKLISAHKKQKILRKGWLDKLKSECDISEENAQIWLKYFIYRYLIKSAYDKKFAEKVRASVVSLLVIGSMEGSFKECAQKYSKETEHNEYNIKHLFKTANKLIK